MTENLLASNARFYQNLRGMDGWVAEVLNLVVGHSIRLNENEIQQP